MTAPLTWMRAVRDSDLPTTVRTVAWAIGLRADRRGQCWPSYQVLADDVRADRRDVIRRVKELRERGWLMVAARSNGHGTQSNGYVLITPTGVGLRPIPPVGEMSPPSDSGPTPQGVGIDPPRRGRPKEVREDMHTQPVDNPVLRAVVNGLSASTKIP